MISAEKILKTNFSLDFSVQLLQLVIIFFELYLRGNYISETTIIVVFKISCAVSGVSSYKSRHYCARVNRSQSSIDISSVRKSV